MTDEATLRRYVTLAHSRVREAIAFVDAAEANRVAMLETLTATLETAIRHLENNDEDLALDFLRVMRARINGNAPRTTAIN